MYRYTPRRHAADPGIAGSLVPIIPFDGLLHELQHSYKITSDLAVDNMAMNYTILGSDIESYVTAAFGAFRPAQYPYHNLDRTRRVAIFSKEIADFYQLDETDQFIIRAAAWFHDTGHLNGDMHGHEERGVKLMEGFLTTIPSDMRMAIGNCIMATKFPSDPKTLNECIVCDADTYHLGTDLFKLTDPLVEQEMEIRTCQKMPDWRGKTLRFLRQHVYFTDYCRQKLEAGKQQNIHWLESLIDPASCT